MASLPTPSLKLPWIYFLTLNDTAMKTIQVKLFEFNELAENAQQKAIEAHRYINVHHQWWDFIYADFIAVCQTIGITVDSRKIFFRGFYSQGDGSGFVAEIDLGE
jgi:hypothetical protein